jgi:hypothetical protein
MSALKEITAHQKMLRDLVNERQRLMAAHDFSIEARKRLQHVSNTIAGVQEMLKQSTRVQANAREMILHAQKELGISHAKPTKKAA